MTSEVPTSPGVDLTTAPSSEAGQASTVRAALLPAIADALHAAPPPANTHVALVATLYAAITQARVARKSWSRIANAFAVNGISISADTLRITYGRLKTNKQVRRVHPRDSQRVASPPVAKAASQDTESQRARTASSHPSTREPRLARRPR